MNLGNCIDAFLDGHFEYYFISIVTVLVLMALAVHSFGLDPSGFFFLKRRSEKEDFLYKFLGCWGWYERTERVNELDYSDTGFGRLSAA